MEELNIELIKELCGTVQIIKGGKYFDIDYKSYKEGLAIPQKQRRAT